MKKIFKYILNIQNSNINNFYIFLVFMYVVLKFLIIKKSYVNQVSITLFP